MSDYEDCPEEPLECTCPVCKEKFTDLHKAKVHIYRKHNNYPGCPICLLSFTSKKRLSYHMRADHPFCGACKSRFRFRDEFYLHNLTAHIEDIIVSNKILTGTLTADKKCRICGARLNTRCYAHIHIQFAHPLLKPFFTNLQSN
ncbi:unnamed protein product [Blepharisma stoltei]|uniref:C2H2-type domain-containing protein n=1 Tax=Blepharisma stoltei TaxID=1481888 RepID=A0AAU9J7F4_9CILI|nr:unnamed protein product [Blepharisma stoltei]